MNAETLPNDEFTYTMPKNLEVALMVASGCWFTIDGFAFAPIGFLFALVTVATKYEATYLASLRAGKKVVARCGAIAALSFLFVAVKIGIAITGVDVGVTAPLLRYLTF